MQTRDPLFLLLFLFGLFYSLFIAFEVLSHLAAAILALGKASLAIDRTVFAGFKRHFAFLLAIRTRCFEHLAGLPAAEPTTTLIRHCLPPLG